MNCQAIQLPKAHESHLHPNHPTPEINLSVILTPTTVSGWPLNMWLNKPSRTAKTWRFRWWWAASRLGKPAVHTFSCETIWIALEELLQKHLRWLLGIDLDARMVLVRELSISNKMTTSALSCIAMGSMSEIVLIMDPNISTHKQKSTPSIELTGLICCVFPLCHWPHGSDP